MRADLAGNTLLTARAVGNDFVQTPQNFYDSTSIYDRVDLYGFTLSQSSSVELTLNEMTGDADLQLLDQDGRALYGSYRSSNQADSITATLAAGDYFVHVSHFHGKTNYHLQIADPNATSVMTVPALTATETTVTQQVSVPVTTEVNSQTAESQTPETPATPAQIAPTPPSDAEPQNSPQRAIPNVITAPRLGAKPQTGQLSIDALLNPNGYYWDTSRNGGVVTYSFYTANSGLYYGNEQVSEVNEAIKSSVREIFRTIENYVDVRFVEVVDTATSYGAVRYMFSDGGGAANGGDFYAYSYYPWFSQIGGDVHLNPTWDARDYASFSNGAGTDGYTTLIHETLHALGLKHPGNYDAVAGNGEGPFLNAEEDHKSNTVMSYNVTGSPSVTPLSYDIRALQYLYGVRQKSTESSVYKFTAPMAYTYAGTQYGHTSRAVNQTIWDMGGIDTIDLSGSSTTYDYYVDLRDGGRVTTQLALNAGRYRHAVSQQIFTAPQYNTSFAYGTVIEQVVSSGGNDQIIANSASNVFFGYGADRFGNDILENTDAADILDLSGNARADLTLVTNSNNLVIDWANGDSVTVTGYFAGSSMKIWIDDQYFTVNEAGSWIASDSPTAADQTAVVSQSNLATDVVANNNVVPFSVNSDALSQSAGDVQPVEAITIPSTDLPDTPPRCHCVLCRPIAPKQNDAPAGLNLVGQSHLSSLI